MNVLGQPVRVGDLTPTTHKDCNVSGCEHQAIWQVGLKFWAENMSAEDRTDKNCAEFTTGVVVCNMHMQKMPFPASEFFQDRGRQMVLEVFKAKNKARPSFDTPAYFFVPTGARPS